MISHYVYQYSNSDERINTIIHVGVKMIRGGVEIVQNC